MDPSQSPNPQQISSKKSGFRAFEQRQPVDDKIIDLGDFEKFLVDRIKALASRRGGSFECRSLIRCLSAALHQQTGDASGMGLHSNLPQHLVPINYSGLGGGGRAWPQASENSARQGPFVGV